MADESEEVLDEEGVGEVNLFCGDNILGQHKERRLRVGVGKCLGCVPTLRLVFVIVLLAAALVLSTLRISVLLAHLLSLLLVVASQHLRGEVLNKGRKVGNIEGDGHHDGLLGRNARVDEGGLLQKLDGGAEGHHRSLEGRHVEGCIVIIGIVATLLLITLFIIIVLLLLER